MVAVIPSASFDQEVLKSTTPVLVDLYADWCGPCRALAPILANVQADVGADVKIVKIDTDKLGDPASDLVTKLMQDNNIRGIPTMLLFDGGGHIATQTYRGQLPSEAGSVI